MDSGGYNFCFFNISEKIVRATVDLIYGKEIMFPQKDKGKYAWFLSKLGVNWQDVTKKIQEESAGPVQKTNEKFYVKQCEQGNY